MAVDLHQTPRDDEAEADVLCAILQSSGRALDDLALTPGEFYRWQHEAIFTSMLAMHAAGAPVTVTGVVDHLRAGGELSRIGGPIFVFDISSRMNAYAHAAAQYAGIVRRLAARRKVVEAGMRMQQLGGNPTDDAGEVVEGARSMIEHLAERIAGPDRSEDYSTALDEALESIEHGTASMSTPWEDLNHLIGGWRKGAVYVVAARPGGGKSIFGTQAAVDAMVRHSVPAAMMSIEMSRTEVLQRCYSQLGEVNLSHIVRGGPAVGKDEWQRLSKAYGQMQDLKFHLEDRSAPMVSDIRAAVSRCVRRHGSCGLLVIDYLQLVAGSGRFESRQTEVAGVSRALKVTAKDLGIPIIVLAQLNRGSEANGVSRPPKPSDLRESGAVEQDADVVILLHRDVEKEPQLLRVGVGKNRHGPTSSLTLDWQGHYSRLLPREWRPSDAAR